MVTYSVRSQIQVSFTFKLRHTCSSCLGCEEGRRSRPHDIDKLSRQFTLPPSTNSTYLFCALAAFQKTHDLAGPGGFFLPSCPTSLRWFVCHCGFLRGILAIQCGAAPLILTPQ
jgi:hypothetical protein